jgi:hypothetical protein
MTRLSTFVAAAAVLVLVVPATRASGQQTRVHFPKAVTTLARADSGVIQGIVLDATGRPLSGAMVSALGTTVAFGLTGRDGRFSLNALPTGDYTVRVHLDGFLPSRRQVVEVGGGVPAVVSVAMHALAGPSEERAPVLLAGGGLAPFDGAPSTVAAASDKKNGDPATTDLDYSETAWRLRHLKRSVLKTVDSQVDVAPESVPSDGNMFGRAFASSLRFASALFSDLPLTGQVNFITTSALSGASGAWSPDAVAAASVAYVALGAPVGLWGEWAVRGAMTGGDLGSWFLSGSFDGRVAGAHRYSGGLAYGAQRVDDVNVFGQAAIPGGSRETGSVFGFDDWTLSPSLALSYGLAYAWQDYVGGGGLLSPRVSVTVTPARHVRVRGVMARYAMAPGSEELIPATGQGSGAWLPARLSFSPLSDSEGFRAQTTDHYEVAVEGVGRQFVIGVRTYFQRTDNQMGAVFAAPTLDRPAASLGHYYVTSVGDLNTRGWTVSVSRPIVLGVRGSVDYSLTTTRWLGTGKDAEWTSWAMGSRPAAERFHDVTTSLETDIPQTLTRVYVLYRINTAFTRPDTDDATPGLAARFDIQVNPALPFMGFTSADWEVLLAVRSLFRDPIGERSVVDELLVVRPPKRVVAGVRVRF